MATRMPSRVHAERIATVEMFLEAGAGLRVPTYPHVLRSTPMVRVCAPTYSNNDKHPRNPRLRRPVHCRGN
ncbi:protein of unknown function [Agreia sp. COWG]|nr:protein of unknown function [Agreia sp. COWG]